MNWNFFFNPVMTLGTRGSGSGGCSGGGGGRFDGRRPRSAPLQIEAVAFGERHSGMSSFSAHLFFFLYYINIFFSIWDNQENREKSNRIISYNQADLLRIIVDTVWYGEDCVTLLSSDKRCVRRRATHDTIERNQNRIVKNKKGDQSALGEKYERRQGGWHNCRSINSLYVHNSLSTTPTKHDVHVAPTPPSLGHSLGRHGLFLSYVCSTPNQSRVSLLQRDLTIEPTESSVTNIVVQDQKNPSCLFLAQKQSDGNVQSIWSSFFQTPKSPADLPQTTAVGSRQQSD